MSSTKRVSARESFEPDVHIERARKIVEERMFPHAGFADLIEALHWRMRQDRKIAGQIKPSHRIKIMQLAEEALSHPLPHLRVLAVGMIKNTYRFYFQNPENSKERQTVDKILQKALNVERGLVPYDHLRARQVLEAALNQKNMLAKFNVSTISLCLSSDHKEDVKRARGFIDIYLLMRPEKGLAVRSAAYAHIKELDVHRRLAGLTLLRVVYNRAAQLRDKTKESARPYIGKALLDSNEEIQKRAFDFVLDVAEQDAKDFAKGGAESEVLYAYPLVHAALLLRQHNKFILKEGPESKWAPLAPGFQEAYCRALRILGFMLVSGGRTQEKEKIMQGFAKITIVPEQTNYFDLKRLLLRTEERLVRQAEQRISSLCEILLPPEQRRIMEQELLSAAAKESDKPVGNDLT